MAKKRRPEPTQPGNPRQLTIDQHVHSRASIARFTNDKGIVAVLRRPSISPFVAKPVNPVFCAQRAWSQKTESLFFKSVEDDFQREVERALNLRTVLDHARVTAYFSIWQIRAQYEASPPMDFVLNGIRESSLTKDQEEILERKGALFTRGPVVPGRLGAQLDAVARHDRNLLALQGIRWGMLLGSTTTGLLCPDCPTTLWMPITRRVMFVAGYPDGVMTDELVDHVNHSAFREAGRFVFGHPVDVRELLRRRSNPWE